MFLNYMKTAFRNFFKHRVYAFINILGLSIGIGVSILMLLFSWNILTFDSFHDNADDLYFLYRDRPSPEGTLTVYDTWLPTVPEMAKEFPEIVRGYRSFSIGAWISHEDKRFREEIDFAEADFFQMFNFPLQEGNPETALQEKSSIVLSREMAAKYFGNETSPLGSVLQLDDSSSYTVTGVLADIPANSTFTYDFIIPWENYTNIPWMRNIGWNGSFLFSYVQLQPGTDPVELEEKFIPFTAKYFDENSPEKVVFRLMPLTQVNNEFSGMDRYAYILLGLTLALIAIACINFTNLTTARSMFRSREIGMRKVLGANRFRLFYQFIGESMGVTALALLIGAGIAELLLPSFNRLVEMNLELSYLNQPKLLFGLIVLGIVVGLFAGIYPAFYLSRFSPIQVLKSLSISKANSRGNSKLRNGLVVAQFVISIGMIIATGIVLRQIDYMKSHDLNFDQSNMMVVNLNASIFPDPESAASAYTTLRNEVSANSAVQAVAFSYSVPGRYRGSYALARPEGWDQGQQLDWRWAAADEKYFDTYGIGLSEGRSFSSEMGSDRDDAVMINEAAKKVIGWDQAEGKTLFFGSQPYRIIGVMKDFHYQSLRDPVQPLIHFYSGETNARFRYMSIKFSGDDWQNNVAAVQAQWDKLMPSLDMNYFLVSENFKQLYTIEEALAEIITYCASLAVLLACLGLFGLSAFNTIQRTKEIGIRKVLGASTPQIVTLIGKDFLKLVLWASLFAWPIGYLVMGEWLQRYPYQMPMGFAAADIFIGAALGALLVALLTVSYQSLKAAFSNPVDAIRYE